MLKKMSTEDGITDEKAGKTGHTGCVNISISQVFDDTYYIFLSLVSEAE